MLGTVLYNMYPILAGTNRYFPPLSAPHCAGRCNFFTTICSCHHARCMGEWLWCSEVVGGHPVWLCKFASSSGNFVRQQKPQLYGPRRLCSGHFFRKKISGHCIHMVELKSRIWEYTDTFENLPNIGQHPLSILSFVFNKCIYDNG